MKNLDLYKQVLFLLRISDSLYEMYIDSGKNYIFARSLYRNNYKIYSLIMGNLSCVDSELETDFQTLLVHYNNWFSQFELNKNLLKNITENTTFFFKRNKFDVGFPKGIIVKLAQFAGNHE